MSCHYPPAPTGTMSCYLTSWHQPGTMSCYSPHNLYGQAEHVAMASSCPQSDSLHVDMAYGVVELVDDADRLIEDPDVVGEVVATGLGNWVAPLIRYRTGDRAAWAAWVAGPCPCGYRGPRLSAIEGRTREVVVDSGGNKHLFGARFYGRLWADGSPVSQAQFRQYEPGCLVVAVVLRDSADNDAATSWIHGALDHLREFDIAVEPVVEIPRTSAGKQQLLVVEPPPGRSRSPERGPS